MPLVELNYPPPSPKASWSEFLATYPKIISTSESYRGKDIKIDFPALLRSIGALSNIIDPAGISGVAQPVGLVWDPVSFERFGLVFPRSYQRLQVAGGALEQAFPAIAKATKYTPVKYKPFNPSNLIAGEYFPVRPYGRIILTERAGPFGLGHEMLHRTFDVNPEFKEAAILFSEAHPEIIKKLENLLEQPLSSPFYPNVEASELAAYTLTPLLEPSLQSVLKNLVFPGYAIRVEAPTDWSTLLLNILKK